jgi:hypothetical protein
MAGTTEIRKEELTSRCFSTSIHANFEQSSRFLGASLMCSGQVAPQYSEGFDFRSYRAAPDLEG